MIHESRAILLAQYAAGTMDDGMALVMASYLTFCRESRGYVTDCEKLAGTMLETLCEPVGMRDGSLQRVLAMLDEPASPRGCRDAAKLCGDIACPAPLAAFLEGGPRWRRATGGGRMARMDMPCGHTQVMVMDIAPGRPLPRVAHAGTMLRLVLRGAYNDEHGHYTTGTLAVYDAGSAIDATTDARQGCVFVTAVEGMQQGIEHPLRRLLNLWRR